jgi:hypothetical protein
MEGGTMDSVQQEVDFKITFTKAALGEMKKFAEAEGVDYFRISVLPGGCSGFKYDFNIIDNYKLIITSNNGIYSLDTPLTSFYYAKNCAFDNLPEEIWDNVWYE